MTTRPEPSGAIRGPARSPDWRPGAIAIECSTVTPAWVRELGAAVGARGAHLLDAPVAGSRPQAEAGQLVFMVGGDDAALASAGPVLEPLAAKVIHVGGRARARS